MRREPGNTTPVHNNVDVWQVFVDAGWEVYFNRFQGFNETITSEFALNMKGNYSRVQGLEIVFTEEVVLVVSGVPQQGHKWFS